MTLGPRHPSLDDIRRSYPIENDFGVKTVAIDRSPSLYKCRCWDAQLGNGDRELGSRPVLRAE